MKPESGGSIPTSQKNKSVPRIQEAMQWLFVREMMLFRNLKITVELYHWSYIIPMREEVAWMKNNLMGVSSEGINFQDRDITRHDRFKLT